MNALHRMYLVPISLAAVALLGGCSGSSPSTPNTLDSGRAVGSVAISLKFAPPLANRAAGAGPGVPIGAQSIKVDITDPANPNLPLAQSQIIAAPGNGTSTSVTFNNIRAGAAHIRAQAFGDRNATAPPLGIVETTPVTPGDEVVPGAPVAPANPTITAGQTTPINLVMAATASSISVTTSPALAGTPPTLTLAPAGTAILMASVLDFNNPAQTPTGFPLAYSSSNANFVTVSPTTTTTVNGSQPTVTITAVAPGSAIIEVREANTGIVADVPVTVTTSTMPPTTR